MFSSISITKECLFFSSERPWSLHQTKYLRMRCAEAIASNRTLKKEEAQMILDECPLLFKSRTWRAIKDKVDQC